MVLGGKYYSGPYGITTWGAIVNSYISQDNTNPGGGGPLSWDRTCDYLKTNPTNTIYVYYLKTSTAQDEYKVRATCTLLTHISLP